MIALVLLCTAGCLKNDLDVQVRFDKNPGVKADDPVIFEGNKVGIIRKVTYTKNGDYLMHVLIESEFKNAATVDSGFYINRDANHPDKFNLVIEQKKPGGSVLEDGALVQGSQQRSFLDRFISDLTTDLQSALEKLQREIEKNTPLVESGIETTINSISTQLQNFKEEVSQLPERTEVKQLGNSLNQLHKDMLSTEKRIRLQIQTDIIPEIEKELEDLKKRLHQKGREQEITPLDSELEKIKKV